MRFLGEFVLGSCAMSAVAYGQPHYHSDWIWEVQPSGSIAWQSGLVDVAPDTSSVRVRARVASNGPGDPFFLRWGFSMFDGTVSLPNMSCTDWIDELTNGDFLNSGLSPVVTRSDSVLKIDAPADLDPPGVGDGWYRARELSPGFDGYRRASLVILEYTLHLDATPGDRNIGHIFGYLGTTTTPEHPVQLLWFDPLTVPPYQPRHPSVTVSNATIRVVPAPGTTAIFLFTSLALAPRRKR